MVGALVGMLASVRTPRPVVDRRQAEVSKIMAAPSMEERLEKLGAEPFLMKPAEFNAFIVDETAKAQKAGTAAGIKEN